MKSSETPWKFVLLGVDAETAGSYQAAAAHEGHHLEYFSSMHDLGYLGRFREYDVAIVHGDLHPLSGLELAEYLETLFQSLPMVLLTPDSELEPDLPEMPDCVVHKFSSSEKAHIVLRRATQALLLSRKQPGRSLMAIEPG